jgi:hypothetical protein
MYKDNVDNETMPVVQFGFLVGGIGLCGLGGDSPLHRRDECEVLGCSNRCNLRGRSDSLVARCCLSFLGWRGLAL